MDNSQRKGYLFGALTALCWATSPIFIRAGLESLPVPILGTAIGLCFATAIYLPLHMLQGKQQTIEDPKRIALGIQALGGVAAGLGILSRNLALELAPVAVVIALSQTTALFTLFLAPLLVRQKRERVTGKLALGILLLVTGSILTILA